MPIYAPPSAPIWTPDMNGLLAASCDPAAATSGATVGDGTVYFVKVPLLKDILYSITNIHMVISTVGTTLDANQNYAGLYYSTGSTTFSQLGKTADQSSNWTSTGGAAPREQKMALASGPFTIRGGPGVFCYVGYLCNTNAGTTVAFYRPAGGVKEIFNVGLVAASGFRGGTGAATQTDLPSSIDYTTLANNSNNELAWVGLS